MNKIKEIAEQSGWISSGDKFTHPFEKERGYLTLCDLEKFAENLIIECTNLTLDYKNDEHYWGWLDFRDEIKKHFGLEYFDVDGNKMNSKS